MDKNLKVKRRYIKSLYAFSWERNPFPFKQAIARAVKAKLKLPTPSKGG